MTQRLHTCTICQRRAPWDEEWSWYGSYRQLDDGAHNVVKACSDACRKEAKRQGLVPKNASLLDAKDKDQVGP